MSAKDVVVVEAIRTPIGRRAGSLASVPAHELLADTLEAVIVRSGVDPLTVGHVVGGCVTQVGSQSSNIARNAWLSAGLPLEVAATTVTAQCGSSQEAMTLTYALIAGGLIDVGIACGVETMTAIPPSSNVPTNPDFGLPRGGRFNEFYEATTQFEAAERIAEQWHLSRDEIDAFGKRSQDYAARAWNEGRFTSQVIPIRVPAKGSPGKTGHSGVVSRDEGMRATTLENLAALRTNPRQADRPSLHTAGTSSQISDGAGAVLLMSHQKANELNLRPLARVIDSVLVGSDPTLMLTGPIPATRMLLNRTGLDMGEIDLFEINEAFASVVLAWQRDTGVDPERVNVNGGAIALGHPLGATGAILLTKAVHELKRTAGRYGLISMCCGGGLGTGTVIERL